MNILDEAQDHGFYHPSLLHPAHCLVYLDVAFDEIADFICRFLRHAAFRTQAQRIGKVVRVYHGGVGYWQVNVKKRMLSGGDSVARVGRRAA